MRKLTTSVICCLLCITAVAQTNKNATGLVYGSDYAFLLTAPKGWLLDNKVGQQQHLSVVFYPKGESWDSAVTAMYATTWTLHEGETVNDVIKADRARMKAVAGNIKTKPDVTLYNNVIAHVIEVNGDPDGNYEEIAYITQRNFVVLIVMTSRTKKDFDKKLGKFYELLKTYKLSKQKE